MEMAAQHTLQEEMQYLHFALLLQHIQATMAVAFMSIIPAFLLIIRSLSTISVQVREEQCM